VVLRSTHRRQLVAGLAVLVGIAVAGCQDPAVEQRMEHRVSYLDRTVKQLREREDDRLNRMGKTLDMLEDKHERDIQETAEAPEKVAERVREHAENVRKRQPQARKIIRRKLLGRPDTLKKTYPKMID
jgi:hypothetical protein